MSYTNEILITLNHIEQLLEKLNILITDFKTESKTNPYKYIEFKNLLKNQDVNEDDEEEIDFEVNPKRKLIQ